MTPEQRSLHARMAAHVLHSKRDPRETTAKARAASPGHIEYWLKKVDPDGTLAPAERVRRAESAKRAHYLKLAMKSAQVRAAKRAAS